MTVMETQFNGRVVAGRYQLGSRRGSGVDAAVFDAFDLVEHRIVAMKVIHPDLCEAPGFERAFRFAAEQGASIKHPNVAEIYDWGADTWNDRKTMYVVVEHLAGGSLREYLDRGRTLTPSQALVVGLDACRALDVIHRRGMVHGDIRPSTLVFGDDQRLRVTDVGLANVVGEALWAEPAHVSNALAMYASPELAEFGERTAKGDVYSLCLTLLESLSGTVPFAGDSTIATLSHRIGRLMPVSADLGPLAAVLERAGRPQPEDRYSAAGLGRALMQAAEKLPRPTPVHLPNAGLFADASGALTRGFAPPEPTEMPAPVAPPIVADPVPMAPPPPPAEVDEELPRRRSWRWAVPFLILLVGAIGSFVYFATHDRVHSYAVPHLAGLSEAEALNQVSEFDWVTTVSREASENVPAGVVIRTNPGEATSIRERQPFQIVVSTGPAPRPLPDVTGLSLADATSRLGALKLVLVEGDPAYDETVPEGTVISWMVPEQPALKAGDTVTPGTKVSVVISKGPQPRVVPDLTGLTPDQAGATLTAQGLLLAQVDPQFSDTVAPGLIAAQDIAPNTNVPRGTTISVAISKGPDVVPIPGLANLTLQQATDALTAAGLTVGTVNGNPDGVIVGAQYQGTDLMAGQLLPRGAAIDITLA
jgi:eukaryotic-like serine/threonine-protein kinase